jgi:hypothetical protein
VATIAFYPSVHPSIVRLLVRVDLGSQLEPSSSSFAILLMPPIAFAASFVRAIFVFNFELLSGFLVLWVCVFLLEHRSG